MRPSLQKVLFTFATGVVSVVLCLGLPAGERSDSRVEMRGGVPTFAVNGRPHSGVCYLSYDCDPANLARRVRHFADAGCDMFNFVVEVSGYGFSRPMWAGEDQWDFSELDQRAGTILAAAPSGMLILRIYIDAPAWWREKNPDEMVVLSNGSTSFGEKLFALPRSSDFPSLASKKWRADMAYALEKVIGHIEESDYGKRLIGVPDGRWQTQDKALAWDAEAAKWSLNYPGGKPGEAQPATLVLKEVRP